MSFDENRGSTDQALLEHEASASSSPRKAVSGRSPKNEADGGVRARARQEKPAGERRVVDSPPLHDDRPQPDEEQGDNPRGFLRRHRFAVLTALVVGIPIAAAGYLYWDNAQHFESTDDSYIAARAFSVQPKVSGFITAVPVTDNQHVAAGAVIAQLDQRDYRAALDQAKAQLTHDQAVLEQAQKNLGRYQYLSKTNSIAQQQVDDQGYLVEQDKSTVALDQ